MQDERRFNLALRLRATGAFSQFSITKIIDMKKYIYILCSTLLFLTATQYSVGQGCVAIRSSGGMTNMSDHSFMDAAGGNWMFSANSRYFKSFRHFKGTDEQEERLAEHTEVINYQYTLDLVLTRIINDRWSIIMDVPILANKRTSLYEHGREERGATQSFGIGDIRFAVYRWLLDPQASSKGNLQLGLGLKLPTGDADYKDYWSNVGENGSDELRTVDQSIQLGDGGTGITAELNAFYQFNNNFGLYGNVYYLSNPRENNGVRTYREAISESLYNEAIMSVPDQYMARVGFNYAHNSLMATAGLRLEGIPVYDLLGGSGDFRRPGYIWSFEPGVSYQVNDLQLFATVPVAFVRHRTQSVTDKQRGPDVNGDAAFADYVINFGVSYIFGKKTALVDHPELPETH